jgi:hypothetical protein
MIRIDPVHVAARVDTLFRPDFVRAYERALRRVGITR